MKAFIVAACFLAVASAGNLGYHIPVLDHNGYQLDTPEVAAAKASHFAAHAEANARTGLVHSVYAAPAVVAAPAIAYAGHYGYAGPQHLPVIGPNGVPLEPAANVAAKAQHAAAHIEAKARNGDFAVYAPHLTYASPLVHYRKRRGAVLSYAAPFYAGPQHLPVIGPNGVPLEPAENVAAKAQHAAAHIEAKARNGDLAVVAPVAYHGAAIAAPVAPIAYAPTYVGPQHLPVIGPNGVPLEPAENVAAKAQHAAAHVEAKVRNGDLYTHHAAVVAAAPVAYAAHHGVHVPVLDHNGYQLDTPEVAAAKVHHYAAHAEALARSHY